LFAKHTIGGPIRPGQITGAQKHQKTERRKKTATKSKKEAGAIFFSRSSLKIFLEQRLNFKKTRQNQKNGLSTLECIVLIGNCCYRDVLSIVDALGTKYRHLAT